MGTIFDILLGTLFALAVSILPAYVIRHKLMKRPMGKGLAVLFVLVGYILVVIAIALHAEISHSEVLTRPGKLFALALVFWMWSIVRTERSRSEVLLGQIDSYDYTSDLSGDCPKCEQGYSIWKQPMSGGKCPNCEHQIFPADYKPQD